MTEDRGWEWNNVARYYLKVSSESLLRCACPALTGLQNSRLVPPADNRSTLGGVDPRDNGFGPVEISLPGSPTEIDQRVLNTSKMSTMDFPFNEDLNSGNAVGIGSYLGMILRLYFESDHWKALHRVSLVADRGVAPLQPISLLHSTGPICMYL